MNSKSDALAIGDVDYGDDDIAFGVDIGGSGIKGAAVDVRTGRLLTKRHRIPTPRPAEPESVGDVVRELLDHFEVPGTARIGVTFPGILQHGVLRSSANMDGDWVGRHLGEVVAARSGRTVSVMNDADAAGYAEARYGAGNDKPGLVLTITLGTGIGSALVHNGVLVPNLEIGHLEIDGYDAETRAAASVKDREGLSYPEWATRLQRYFEVVEFLFSPDLFIIGGGVSKDHEEFLPLITTHAPMVPAQLRNQAGIVGAAGLAAQHHV
ncbi:ROK family protein [Pseudactinotalea sp. HY160]|uniref:polyphosphate--glucose phosphotransferase n=1 Tax=Pseudactinotalea sp. HY160 TaxID=2654490 RepID=UPI00128D3446|nr:ROK family protein [Pseudactinotalea sp. HY160]MPV50011.1 ROK family protein [Pseudactinotalea sp. HY160]